MKLKSYIKAFFYIVRRCNISKTLYINFLKLPFSQAIRLPIYIYGKTEFRSLNGDIVIQGDVRSGMIKVGKNDYYVKTSVPLTVWVINGVLKFNGSCKFMNGGYLCISKRGHLELGNDVLIGSDYKIMCFDSIRIGDLVQATYNIQIYDTSYHYVEDEYGVVKKLTKPIFIGDRVWIGNSSIVSRGSKIPDNTIVANGSLVNKDFSFVDGKCLIAGCPACVKKEGIHRIFDLEKERYYDAKFGYDRTHL